MSAIRKLQRNQLRNEVIETRELLFVDGKPYIKQKGDKVKNRDIKRKKVKVKRGNSRMGNLWRKAKRSIEFIAINDERERKGKKKFKFDKKGVK